jgi:hypothetical protein
MMTDFRALCAELVDAWLKGDDIVGAMNRARAALADEPPEPAPPADGEVAELVRTLTGIAHWRRRGRPGEGDPSPFDIRQADRLDRAAELLQRQVLVQVAVSDALIKAECALSDIAEGEPMTDEGDPLKWAERRCADTLAIIRPTMMQHKIRTSEWPPVAATAKPQPVPVSERPPGPGDCTTNPRTGEGQWCWGWVQHDPIPYSGRWRMIRREWLVDEAKAWLPAHALPLPEVGE